MSQALLELRGPVTQEALRLRMVAMHGREDALLDPARFIRLLRQANDAEVADVRKVGEDEYEISAHRTAALISNSLPAAPRAEPQPPAEGTAAPDDTGAPPVAEPAAAGRDNGGGRFGVRYRRGSRGALRPGEIPLVGVVQVESAPDPVEAPASADRAEPEADGSAEAPAKKPARPRRAPRKKAAAAAAAAPEPSGEAAPAPAKRPRSRAKKKAE
jgi:hypothetical protein